MTMSLLPGVNGALDVCDITIILERTANTCTVYLRGNSAIACNASASDVADAINVDEIPYILPGIQSSIGVVWVNGQNVLRLSSDPATGGTLCQMEVGGGTFLIPSLTLENAIEGVNECGRCGGGGGGGGGEVVPWAPEPDGGANATGVNQNFAYASRIGNQVSVYVGVIGITTANGPVTVTVPLPLDALVPVEALAQGDAGLGLGAAVAAEANVGNLTLTFQGVAATAFAYWAGVTYQTFEN